MSNELKEVLFSLIINAFPVLATLRCS